MTKEFEELEVEDALSAALRMSASIKNADAYDDVASSLAHRYAQRSVFDRAVGIADTIKDPYTMDKTIGEIAVAAAAAGYETEAFELIESIEELSHQATSTSQIAIATAVEGNFDRAIEIAKTLDDNAATLSEIARLCAINGEIEKAQEILDLLDFPIYSAWVRLHMADGYGRAGRTEEALESISMAKDDAEQIDTTDERATTLAEVAVRFSEAGDVEQADEILTLAIAEAAEAEELYRDTVLSQIAVSFGRLKQYDRAVEVAEKIEDVYQVTATLVRLAVAEFEDGSRQAEASQLLSDALDLIRDEAPLTQRAEAQRHNLLALVALRFADFGNRESAIQASNSIHAEDERILSIANVAVRYAQAGQFDEAHSIANLLDGKVSHSRCLLGIAREAITAKENDRALPILTEARALIESLEISPDKVHLLMELSVIQAGAGQTEEVTSFFNQSLDDIRLIKGEYPRATAMLAIADASTKLEYEFDDQLVEMLWEIAAV